MHKKQKNDHASQKTFTNCRSNKDTVNGIIPGRLTKTSCQRTQHTPLEFGQSGKDQKSTSHLVPSVVIAVAFALPPAVGAGSRSTQVILLL